MLWVCKLLQLNHLRLQTLVRLVAKPTYQPHQTLRHGWIYEITFWNAQFTLWKKNQLAVVFLDKHCGPHACSIQIWITRTPPPPFNTSAFYQHVGISPGILGPHGHLTSNTWFCCQLQQGMAKGTMTCRDSAWGKCQKHQTQFTYRSLRGFRQWIRVYHWYLLMITIGLWRISSNLSNSIHHSLLPWSSTKIFCYLLAYISIYIYRKYIYIYVDS